MCKCLRNPAGLFNIEELPLLLCTFIAVYICGYPGGHVLNILTTGMSNSRIHSCPALWGGNKKWPLSCVSVHVCVCLCACVTWGEDELLDIRHLVCGLPLSEWSGWEDQDQLAQGLDFVNANRVKHRCIGLKMNKALLLLNMIAGLKWVLNNFITKEVPANCVAVISCIWSTLRQLFSSFGCFNFCYQRHHWLGKKSMLIRECGTLYFG